LILDDQFMKDAIVRINELQQNMVDKSKEIDGAEEYIAKKLELYDKSEELSYSSESIRLEEEKLSNEFFNTSKKL